MIPFPLIDMVAVTVVELKMPLEKYQDRAVKYLAEQCKSFEDIRIAVAGLEAIKQDSSRARTWLVQVEKMRNPDGTYGKDLAQARDTGGAVVAVLRLKGKVTEPKTVLKVLKDGQRLNGGYGKENHIGIENFCLYWAFVDIVWVFVFPLFYLL